ncbi:hypothetical protein Tco_0738247, partial [Tanacetum coccineum]
MVWRHPSTVIDDPRPVASSFRMVDVCRLSAHVVKLRDMPEGVLVLSGLSRVWKIMGIYDFLCFLEWTGAEVLEEPYLDVRPTLQRLPFYRTPPAATDAIIPDPTPKDLVVGSPNSKIFAKAEASQKRKASTSGATSIHVEKRTRSALAQSSGSTTRPSLFVGDDDRSDDDDDACSNPQGKGIMADDAAAPSVGVNRPRPSSEHVPLFRDVSGDAIHTDFFPFSVGPYYATYPENELDSTMKGYEEKVAILTGLELQVSTLKKQGLVRKFLASDEFSRVQGQLLSLAASAEFKLGLSMHQTKDEFAVVLKKMANFMPGAQD